MRKLSCLLLKEITGWRGGGSKLDRIASKQRQILCWKSIKHKECLYNMFRLYLAKIHISEKHEICLLSPLNSTKNWEIDSHSDELSCTTNTRPNFYIIISWNYVLPGVMTLLCLFVKQLSFSTHPFCSHRYSDRLCKGSCNWDRERRRRRAKERQNRGRDEKERLEREKHLCI